MKALFHHAYDVKTEDGKYCPVRFSDGQFAGYASIDPKFERLARCSSGISLKCYTDAEEVSFAYRYPISYTRMGGFDVYENGVLCKCEALPEESCDGTFTYRKKAAGETLMEIFLPANAEMSLWDLSFGNWRPADHPQKLVLHIGASSTQCAYMTTPSLSYVTLASMSAGVDYINRGVGSMFFDERTLCEDDTLCPDEIFVHYGGNDLVKHGKHDEVVFHEGVVQYCTAEDVPGLIEKAKGYLEKLCRIYPSAKITVISTSGSIKPVDASREEAKTAYYGALRNTVEGLGLHYVDCAGMHPCVPEVYYRDLVHLNALGNALFASEFGKLL